MIATISKEPITRPFRLSAAAVDLDNNGVSDEEIEYRYNASNQRDYVKITYFGDGVEDRFTALGGETGFEINYSYDDRNNLVSIQQDILLDDSVREELAEFQISSFEFTYTYGGSGKLDSHVLDRFNPLGVLVDRSEFEFSYDGDRISSYSSVFTFFDPSFPLSAFSRVEYSYGDDGLVEERRRIDEDMGSETLQTRFVYTWNSDGLITGFEQIPVESFSFISIDFMRLDDGRLLSQEIRSDPISPVLDSTYGFTYDLNGNISRIEIDELGDGVIDAVVTYTWEPLPCRSSFVWAESALPNYRLSDAPSLLFTPGSGFTDTCGVPRLF